MVFLKWSFQYTYVIDYIPLTIFPFIRKLSVSQLVSIVNTVKIKRCRWILDGGCILKIKNKQL